MPTRSILRCRTDSRPQLLRPTPRLRPKSPPPAPCDAHRYARSWSRRSGPAAFESGAGRCGLFEIPWFVIPWEQVACELVPALEAGDREPLGEMLDKLIADPLLDLASLRWIAVLDRFYIGRNGDARRFH